MDDGRAPRIAGAKAGALEVGLYLLTIVAARGFANTNLLEGDVQRAVRSYMMAATTQT